MSDCAVCVVALAGTMRAPHAIATVLHSNRDAITLNTRNVHDRIFANQHRPRSFCSK
jgi:hypothetical protein